MKKANKKTNKDATKQKFVETGQIIENPFPFTPSSLTALIDPKNLNLLKTYGGIEGLLKGLHTDGELGLSNDETSPLERKTLNDIANEPSLDEIEPDVREDSKSLDKMLVINPNELVQEGTPFWQRKTIFGINVLPDKKRKSLFRLMWIAIQDKILIILTVAAIISLALGIYEDFIAPTDDSEKGQPKIKWVEGVAIVVAILIVVMVGSINDWQKEKQFQRLNAKKEDRTVKVTRNGREALLSVFDVLVGDILHLEPGDIIAVDGVLVSGHNLRCDESAATGESDAVRKFQYKDCVPIVDDSNPRGLQTGSKGDPFLISGSKVLEGVGRYVVTAVGANSFYGHTLMTLRTDSEDTPLQEKLNDLAEKIAKLGGAAALLMLIVLMIKYFVNFRNGVPKATQAIEDLVQIIISAVTVVVVAVPEGLPLAVTLALAYATTRMLKDNNLVRVLSACETMGNATTICSDKTGTLTQNKMTVAAGTIGLTFAFVRDPERFRASDKNSSRKSITENFIATDNPISIGEIRASLPAPILDLFNQSISINSTAFEGETEADGKITFVGSKTETALLGFLLDIGLSNFKELRQSANIIQLFPFSSDRKAMGVVVKISDSKWRFYVKGASEVLVSKSANVVITDPKTSSNDDKSDLIITKLTSEYTNIINHIIVIYASQTLRTIGLGYQDFEEWPPKGMHVNNEGDVLFEELVENITLLGIVGIEDPLREGVREAVEECKKAGVVVRMVTGDNVLTAKSIATQCGIYTTGGKVLEGPNFRNLSPQEMENILPRLQVLARSSPEDKRILVAKLKELGDIVAVTGDGTNDGPALKTADVGFSMGISGTEVAKEASSIILMDDNFSSIVKAIMWGRSVNDAVKKFLQFQLTVNVTAVFLTFISAVSSGSEKSVLSAVQLLWVNLIMDTLAALALATDPPTKELLNRKPEPRTAPLISFDMWKMIIGQSIIQLVFTLVLFYAGNNILKYKTEEEQSKLPTLIFNTFVFFQIFNEINCRRLDHKINIFKGITANPFFMIIFVLVIAGQILIVELGGQAFQVKPLNIEQWGISVGLGFLSIPFGVVIRLIPNEMFWFYKPTTPTRPGTLLSQGSIYAPSIGGIPAIEKPIWNKAITDVRNELIVFKSLRGGRLRASLHFHHRDKPDTKSAFAAATMVPSLVAGSVGAGWAPTLFRSPGTSRPVSNNPSASQLELSSQRLHSSQGPGIRHGLNESHHRLPTPEASTSTSPSSRRALDSMAGSSKSVFEMNELNQQRNDKLQAT
ncbi:hypothetical protein G9A89_010053 [Geosiphon pyriformis]|nr:hypothetical protein G9A89_010053 [Geosiphon pyriformis]